MKRARKRKAREWWATLAMTPYLWPTRKAARKHKAIYYHPKAHIEIVRVREVLPPRKRRT